jgi:hypothetical protein
VAEDLGSAVPLVSGDWLSLWRVAVAHHLHRVVPSKQPSKTSTSPHFSFLSFFLLLARVSCLGRKTGIEARLTRMLSPLLNGSLKMACGLQSETKRGNRISNEELVTMQARKET